MLNISPYITIPLVAVLIAQILKFAIHAFTDEIDFNKLLLRGGLPSTFVSAVVAISLTSVAVDGFDSSVSGAILAVSAVMLAIFYDLQKNRQRLNSINEEEDLLPETNNKDMLFGALTGALTALFLSVTYWKDDLSWLFVVPKSTENIVYFALFGALFAIGELLSFMSRRKQMRKLPTSRKLNRAFRLTLTAPAVFGIFLGFAQNQTLGMFDVRIWVYITLTWVIAGTIWAYFSVYRIAPKHLKEEREHFSKTKSKAKTKAKKKSSKKKKRK